MKDKYLFIDAETDGLYGAILTVAMLVMDDNGKELEHRYFGIAREKQTVTNDWVMEHVIPIMGEYDAFSDEETLLEMVWEYWRRWSAECDVVADVPYPVEARLFQNCVKHNQKEREMQAPYPLLDLASALCAKGIDPLADRYELCEISDDSLHHNCLEDVYICAKIWYQIILGK